MVDCVKCGRTLSDGGLFGEGGPTCEACLRRWAMAVDVRRSLAEAIQNFGGLTAWGISCAVIAGIATFYALVAPHVYTAGFWLMMVFGLAWVGLWIVREGQGLRALHRRLTDVADLRIPKSARWLPVFGQIAVVLGTTLVVAAGSSLVAAFGLALFRG